MKAANDAIKFLLSMFMNGPHKKTAQELLDALNASEKEAFDAANEAVLTTDDTQSGGTVEGVQN